MSAPQNCGQKCIKVERVRTTIKLQRFYFCFHYSLLNLVITLSPLTVFISPRKKIIHFNLDAISIFIILVRYKVTLLLMWQITCYSLNIYCKFKKINLVESFTINFSNWYQRLKKSNTSDMSSIYILKKHFVSVTVQSVADNTKHCIYILKHLSFSEII